MMATKVDLRAEEMADNARNEPNPEARAMTYIAAALYSIDRTCSCAGGSQPMTYHCKHCDKIKSEAEVIKVPRDLWGKAGFMGCRVCNRRTVAQLCPIT